MHMLCVCVVWVTAMKVSKSYISVKCFASVMIDNSLVNLFTLSSASNSFQVA